MRSFWRGWLCFLLLRLSWWVEFCVLCVFGICIGGFCVWGVWSFFFVLVRVCNEVFSFVEEVGVFRKWMFFF